MFTECFIEICIFTRLLQFSTYSIIKTEFASIELINFILDRKILFFNSINFYFPFLKILIYSFPLRRGVKAFKSFSEYEGTLGVFIPNFRLEILFGVIEEESECANCSLAGD